MVLRKRLLSGMRGIRKSGLRGKILANSLQTSGRLKIRRVNQRNKYEHRIAEKLGGKLTAGSGAVFSDGDIRAGKYLIEHKARKRNTITIPYNVFAKIAKQATARNLLPALVLSFLPALAIYNQEDLVVLEFQDAIEHFRDTEIKCMADSKKRKSISVSLVRFAEGCIPFRGGRSAYGLPFIPVQVLPIERHQSLCVSYLSDFVTHSKKT